MAHLRRPSNQGSILTLVFASIAVLAGFFMLVWGAVRFVFGAAGTARSFGIPPLIIGLTIVGFGTSAPELLVSSLAALKGEPGMGVGNALGSNITNIALVLGVATLVRPLSVHRSIVVVDAPVLLGVMSAAFLLLIDGELSRVDGTLLLSGLALMIGIVVRQGLKGKAPPNTLDDVPETMSPQKAIFWLIVGLGVLLVGAKLLVDNAVAIALSLGVDSTVIGLTVIAFGTSLPELAATITAARKNEHDIALGNIIGSNMFNVLGVLGLPGVIAPSPIDEDVVLRDGPVMLGVVVLFWLIVVLPPRAKISRAGGALLVLSFAAYMTWVGIDSYGERSTVHPSFEPRHGS